MSPETGTLVLELPEPPSANRYWRHVEGRVVLSARARAYKATVATRALVARVHPLPLGVECAVSVRWFRGRRSGDLDNRIKIVLDALQGAAYVSDAQVVELHAYRADDKAAPRCEVTVTPLTIRPLVP